VACTQTRISYNLGDLAMNKSKGQDWQAANLDDVQEQTSNPLFIQKSACGCQIAIHTFVDPGDSLEGRLRPCPNHDRADRAGCVHLFLPTQNGEVGVAIRLTNMLRQAIFDNNLFGCYIRITYKGSVPTKWGHAKKIYLVEVDRGAVTEKFEPVDITYRQNRKPRKRRPIRRPAMAQIK